MEPIIQAYDLPSETVTFIMILYKNTETMFPSHDGNTNFQDIVAGNMQRDIFALYIFIIITLIDLMKENGFASKKTISRLYPADSTTRKLRSGSSASCTYTCRSRNPLM